MNINTINNYCKCTFFFSKKEKPKRFLFPAFQNLMLQSDNKQNHFLTINTFLFEIFDSF